MLVIDSISNFPQIFPPKSNAAGNPLPTSAARHHALAGKIHHRRSPPSVATATADGHRYHLPRPATPPPQPRFLPTPAFPSSRVISPNSPVLSPLTRRRRRRLLRRSIRLCLITHFSHLPPPLRGTILSPACPPPRLSLSIHF